MTTTNDAAIRFAHLCENDHRLMELESRYDNGEELSAAEFNELCDRMNRIHNSPFIRNMIFESLEDETW